MLWAYTIVIISFTQQGKYCHPTGFTLPLAQSLSKAPCNHIANGSLGVMTDQLSCEERWGNIRAAGTADILGAWTGERLITRDHDNQQVRVIISQGTGQGKMTLKYDQTTFLFTLLGHYPWIRVSIAKKHWIYFSTECKIRKVYQAKYTNSTKLSPWISYSAFQ